MAAAHQVLTLLPSALVIDPTYCFPSSDSGSTYKVTLENLSIYLFSTKNLISESSDYTIQTTDEKSIVVFSGSGNIILTVPNNNDENISIGTIIDIGNNRSSGSVNVVGSSGVDVNSSIGLYINNYGLGSLIKIDTNSWILSGDLSIS